MRINSAILSIIVLIIFPLQEICLSQVPYVPTPESVVEGMLAVAKVTDKDIVYDLGCGDGRIVVTAAKKYGAHGVGIDNNPERIKDSWANAKQNGVTNMVDFREQDLFATNLRDATVVTLYLLTEVNLKLRPKLFRELKPGTRVVSHSFSMDTWEPDSLLDVEGRNVYYWKMPVNASGRWEITIKDGKMKDKYSLQLDQVFQKVDGSVQIGSEKYYIAGSRLDGDKLVFSVNAKRNGNQEKMSFSSRVAGDELQGTIETEANDPVSFTAKRQKGTMKPLDPAMAKTGLK